MNDLAEEYGRKTHKEHIMDIPDTYIGSIENETTVQYIMDDDFEDDDDFIKPNSNPKFTKKEFNYNPGLKSIVEEILINAYDNINRINQKNSKLAKGKRTFKEVTYLKGWADRELGQIVVENDGEGIDVAEHPTEKKDNGDPYYIPELIFGELLTSANYDKTGKITGGKNGYGAKLTNIFSIYFKIETVDRHRKLKFTQEFKENMDIKCPPKIEKYTGSSFTRITFRPDFKKFGLHRMDKIFESLIKKRFYDMYICANTKVNVYFNDKKLGLDSYYDYYNMYLPKDYLCAEGESVDELNRPNIDEFNKSKIVFSQPNDRWSIAACPSPKLEFEQISFVNGINTSKGGTHVNYIVSQITSKMVDLIKKKKKVLVKEQFVKENLMVFVNAIIEDPKFDSQTKSYHTTPKTKFGSVCEISNEFINKLYDTGIVDTIIELTILKSAQEMSRSDGNKRKKINVEKYEPADWAATKHASKCILILTEGDSAKGLAMDGRGVIKDGTKTIGIYPLKGKPLNTRDISSENYNKNKEISDIKLIMGLKEGQEYSDVSSLRYGKIMLMADQDYDGFHIKGLIMNFMSRWPSLMKIDGFICCLLTPIVKVWKGKNKDKAMNFYTMSDFKNWLTNTENSKKYNYKYYKGLGTSTPKEAKEYFRDLKIVSYKWDDYTEKYLDMVFCTDKADARKTWLSKYDEDKVLDVKSEIVVYPDFFNYEFIHFSNYDNIRSIPNMMDGFKPSLRKIIFACFKRNLTSEIKVSQLGGYISEHTNYHHGEASLFGAITGIAQSYTGSNNINLLHPEGQFGTRLSNGKDASQPRYIHTFLEKITFKIFNKIDNPLLKYCDDDGDIAEPTTYYPIIPMVLVNGSNGIGTGWSSKIPSFNPLDIITNIKLLLNDKPINSLTPYYRGFKGSITKRRDCSWLIKGTFTSDSKSNTITISEIPFTTSIEDFTFMLSNMLIGAASHPNTNKKAKGGGKQPKKKKRVYTEYLKNFSNDSTGNSIHYVLYLSNENFSTLLSGVDKDGLTKFEREFNMTSSVTCANTMNFYNEHNKLVTFKSIESILEYFVRVRLVKYKERYEYVLRDLQIRSDEISIKARFIQDIVNENIEIRNRSKQIIIDKIDKLKYPKVRNIKHSGGRLRHIVLTNDQYNKLKSNEKEECNYDFLFAMDLLRLTAEKIEELKNERDIILDELKILKSKTEKDLWLEDLEDFTKEYDKYIKEYCVYYEVDSKEFDKKGKMMNKKSDLSHMIKNKNAALRPKKKFKNTGLTRKNEVIVDLN
jgi:DNA topoisomerase II